MLRYFSLDINVIICQIIFGKNMCIRSISMCSQASSQPPQTVATWWPPCSQPSEARGSRRSCPCPIAASRRWTLRASGQEQKRHSRLISVAAAVRPHWASFCRWGEEIEQDWSWPLENSPSQPHPRSCHRSALRFFTPAHRNGSPALFNIPLVGETQANGDIILSQEGKTAKKQATQRGKQSVSK